MKDVSIAARSQNEKLLNAIDRIDQAANEDLVIAEFEDFIADYGFDSIALGYLANPFSPPGGKPFQVSNWPTEWHETWVDGAYLVYDPIAAYALRSRRTFTWHDAYEYASKFGRAILDESKNFGFTDGLAMPIHTIDAPLGCVSIGGETTDLSPAEIGRLELVATHAYSKLEQLRGPQPLRGLLKLSKRETEVLQFAAAGKTNWEIGMILGIQEETVKGYNKSAARKLGGVSKAHTVSIAIQHALILP